MPTKRDWTRREVELVVNDYMEMLILELSGKQYNKSATRRTLLQKLDNRTEGSIERKRMNVSAALLDAGLPSIDGYKPYSNYQAVLSDVVDEIVISDLRFKQALDLDMTSEIRVPKVEDILSVLESEPERKGKVRDKVADAKSRRSPLGLNYLEIDAANTSLGLAGEEFCINYEKARLIYEGAEAHAERVEHIAETEGPSAGFDVLSFESNGQDRLIEVKTTKFGRRTPFFITPNEVRFSAENEKRYHLYRLHNFMKSPRFFILRGSVAANCELKASEFKAFLK